MKGGYKIIDFKSIPLSDSEHPVLIPDLRAVLDNNYNKAVLLTNVVLGSTPMDDCFSTVVLKDNGRIKLNSYDGYITVDSGSYAHYTEGGSGDPTAEIEEIKEDISDIQADIGDLSELETVDQSDLVSAVNEVAGSVDDLGDDVGDLSDLETSDQTSIVNAVNEVNTKLSKTEVLYIKDIACSATTGNFVTKSDARITANHVVTECVFSKPSAITSGVNWTTASGSLTLNGTCTDATCTVSVILALSNNN